MREEDIVSSQNYNFEEESAFQKCCKELARRVWVTVVISGQYSSEQQRLLYGLVRNILDGEKGIEEAVYELAVGLGMPALPDAEGNPGMVRMMSIHHIVSTIQCAVMILSHGSTGQDEVMQGENISPDMTETKRVSDMVRELGRTFGSKGDACLKEDATATEILRDLCHCVEESKHKLPEGFFDVMISSEERNSWTEEELATLAMVGEKLAQETRLRQRMMVDRALATLKSFSSSQLIRGNPGLVRALDTYTEEAKETMEMICSSKVADIDDACRMTKGEIASLLMENTFDNDGSQKKAAKVKTITIGSVPDRGGRPEGVSRAAALMPSWQKRKASSTHEKANQKNQKKKSGNKNNKGNSS